MMPASASGAPLTPARAIMQHDGAILVRRGAQIVPVDYHKPAPIPADQLALQIPRVVVLLLLVPNAMLVLFGEMNRLGRYYLMLSIPSVLLLSGYMGGILIAHTDPAHGYVFYLSSLVAAPLSLLFFGTLLSRDGRQSVPSAPYVMTGVSVVVLLAVADGTYQALYVMFGLYVLIVSVIVYRTQQSAGGLSSDWRLVFFSSLLWGVAAVAPLLVELPANYWVAVLLIANASIAAPLGLTRALMGDHIPARLARPLHLALPMLVVISLVNQVMTIISAALLPAFGSLHASGYALVMAVSIFGSAMIMWFVRPAWWAMDMFYGSSPRQYVGMVRAAVDAQLSGRFGPDLGERIGALTSINSASIYLADGNRLALFAACGPGWPATAMAAQLQSRAVFVPVYVARGLIGAFVGDQRSPLARGDLYDGTMDVVRLIIGMAYLQRRTERLLNAAQDEARTAYHRGSVEATHRLVGHLSHRLSTPLARLMLESDAVDSNGEAVHQIAQTVAQVRDILEPITEPSRTENVTAACLDALAEALIDDGRIAPRLNMPELPPVAMPQDRLARVLVDVLRNAADAVSQVPRPVIRLSGYTDGEFVCIEIGDNGAGIEPHQLPMVAEPYFSTKPNHEGLGLSRSMGSVMRYGGDLQVDSDYGVGTVVTIRLPIAGQGEAEHDKGTVS